jgi:hypothetical protein
VNSQRLASRVLRPDCASIIRSEPPMSI